NLATNETAQALTLTLQPALPSLVANSGAIVFRGNVTNATAGPGPYPSSINVAGLSNGVFNVTVTLLGMTNVIPANLDVLLVGPAPGGTTNKVMLMSGAGPTTAVNDTNLR